MSIEKKERKITLSPGSRFRLQAGPYDPDTGQPRYAVEVSAPDEHSRRQVEDNSHIMGVPGSHFYVWDVTNGSSWPVFLTLTVDGVSSPQTD
ncbi:hypothetical protein V2K54_25940 [Pseudomonas alliivorans]|nr:hypothetical protein [Pseudomonas alliivorans]